eukprot:2728484-Amphidinium_carterae.1
MRDALGARLQGGREKVRTSLRLSCGEGCTWRCCALRMAMRPSRGVHLALLRLAQRKVWRLRACKVGERSQSVQPPCCCLLKLFDCLKQRLPLRGGVRI